jgi:hypothetical protein
MAAVTRLQGRLTITVHRGTDVKDVQLVGKQDPYCKVKLGNEKFKTKVADDGGREPKWEQSFLFNLDGKSAEQDIVHFEVHNHNLTTDDGIGRADIKTLELVKELKKKRFIQLVDFDNFTKTCGKLEITVEFEGSGLPTATAATTTTAAAVTPAPQPIVQQPQPVVQQQPIVQQKPIVQQPIMQQPIQQPIYQQPIMQQPIMQQPMMQPMYQPMMQPVMMQPVIVAPTIIQAQDGMEIMDPRHPHALRHLSSVYQGIYTCNGCGQEGRGKVWHCGICDFDLHPHCTQQRFA